MDSYQISDERLVGLAREGERQAFDALFGRYLALVRGEARRWGLHASEGDVVQETFLRAYLNLGELRDPGKFASWLRAISHRVCASETRSRAREEALTEQLRVPRAPAQSFELRQLLAGLPPEDREPLHLHYVLGLDTAAGARALGLTPAAFRVRLHRARKRARALAHSQAIEEKIIMSGQDRHQLARQLLKEALRPAETVEEAVADPEGFRSKLEQAHQAAPEENDITWYHGRQLARDGRYQEAIAVLQPLWERAPDPWVGITLGWCHDYLGHREKAIEYYARVAVMPFLSETQRRIVAAGVEAPQKPKARPEPPEGLAELKNDGWSATASHETFPPGFPASRGIDGEVRTAWSTGKPQTPDMWYRIDLGKQVEGLAGIWTDDDTGGTSLFQNSAPRRCLVSVSREGEWWKRVGEYRWSPNTYMEAWWEPVSARYLLMEQMEYSSPEYWIICEAHLFAAK